MKNGNTGISSRADDIFDNINLDKKKSGITSTTDLLCLKAEKHTDPKYTWLLQDLQANILKPHGKKCALLTFISFSKRKEHKEEIKNALAKLPLTSAITEINKPSTKNLQENLQAVNMELEIMQNQKGADKNMQYDQKEENLSKQNSDEWNKIRAQMSKQNDNGNNSFKRLVVKSNRENQVTGEPVVCFYLSHAGYKFFGSNDKGIFGGSESSFSKGLMEGTGFGTEKSTVKSDVGPLYRHFEIHAMLMVAFDDNDLGPEFGKTLDEKINGLKDYIRKETAGYANVFFETGFRNPERSDDKIKAKEWFGFVDGISNPRFFPDPKAKNTKIIEWEGPSCLDLVLRPDGGASPDACGSFLVFMKFEQDKTAFENAAAKLAKNIFGEKISKENIEYAASMLVGRHQDGTPLTLSERQQYRDNEKDDDNELKKNFNYDDDRLGLKCPFHAHIRKANPREGDHNRRIVRRGMVYGSEHEKEKGILFMSFQGDLEQQFEYIVNQYLFKYDHRGRDVGEDPIVGKGSSYQRYYKKWGKGGESASSPHQPFVTFKGGLYFFAPSISYIKTTLGKNW